MVSFYKGRELGAGRRALGSRNQPTKLISNIYPKFAV
jgi:hypothetical protein